MPDLRAILVSSHQIRLVDECTGEPPADQPLRDLVAAFDAAGDQPHIRWCVEHGRVYAVCPHEKYACRVVDAIVVPLEEGS